MPKGYSKEERERERVWRTEVLRMQDERKVTFSSSKSVENDCSGNISPLAGTIKKLSEKDRVTKGCVFGAFLTAELASKKWVPSGERSPLCPFTFPRIPLNS